MVLSNRLHYTGNVVKHDSKGAAERVLATFRQDWPRWKPMSPPSQGAVLDVLSALPSDVDPELAAAAIGILFIDPLHVFGLYKACRNLPGAVLRCAVPELQAGSVPGRFAAEATDLNEGDEAAAKTWQVAMRALERLNGAIRWGSKPHKAIFEEVARDPALLRAAQTVVTTCTAAEPMRSPLHAVLAWEGSAASVQALDAMVARAEQTLDEDLHHLDGLRKPAADTKEMASLVARIDRAFERRKATAAATELACLLKLDIDPLWLSVTLTTTLEDPSVHVFIDNRNRAANFDVIAQEGTSKTSFNRIETIRDDLELGRCDVAELPKWIDAARDRFNVAWSEPHAKLDTNARGSAKRRILEWLFGR